MCRLPWKKEWHRRAQHTTSARSNTDQARQANAPSGAAGERKAAAAAGSWIRDVNIEAEEIQFIKMAWGRLELRSSGTTEEH
ncbi:hypothetical protein E4U57_000428 [Claviceps arundinis]|uniref:Uncharacterized protein n=1 Tax=Claviceps arundinis TaxID=1623583 RepID=A0ABQ7PMI1_9HYPO|nr:hypothetical protein E4U57_000428 [Claviceps arundinis]